MLPVGRDHTCLDTAVVVTLDSAVVNAAAATTVSCMHRRIGCMQTDLADGAVGLQEVGLQEGVKQVAGHALDGVVDGQHVDALAILDVSALQPGQRHAWKYITWAKHSASPFCRQCLL